MLCVYLPSSSPHLNNEEENELLGASLPCGEFTAMISLTKMYASPQTCYLYEAMTVDGTVLIRHFDSDVHYSNPLRTGSKSGQEVDRQCRIQGMLVLYFPSASRQSWWRW